MEKPGPLIVLQNIEIRRGQIYEVGLNRVGDVARWYAGADCGNLGLFKRIERSLGFRFVEIRIRRPAGVVRAQEQNVPMTFSKHQSSSERRSDGRDFHRDR